MTAGKGYSIGIGDGGISVTPEDGCGWSGVSVEVCGVGYSQSVLVADCDRIRVARALRAAESFEALDGFGGATLWATPDPQVGWLTLSAATDMAHHDMQYPFVRIGPKVAVRVADLIDPDPLTSARRRTDDNLRKVFG